MTTKIKTASPSPSTSMHWPRASLWLCVALLAVSTANAGPREQAKRMHDRLVGTPPTSACLQQLEDQLGTGSPTDAFNAALDAIDPSPNDNTDACQDPSFYNVTLKNMVTPWTNEAQTAYAPLNDYTATVIGLVRDDADFRSLLYADVLYTGDNQPNYSNTSNAHYETLEDSGANLFTSLTAQTQSAVTGLPSQATAGIMTSRAAAKAFFVDGTNRAMLRFTMLNHLCTDMEQIKDPTRSTDRIRQDVSRSPGGDSRIYLNACSGCHAGMDPLAQAYAYYNYSNEDEQLVYTPNSVQDKYLINASNFKWGYATPNDHWDNYWREGSNTFLGWDAGLSGSGIGAKSMGQELAHTQAYARCQVQKVFKNVCLRPPVNAGDSAAFATILNDFTSSYNYNLKHVFAATAVHCMGQ